MKSIYTCKAYSKYHYINITTQNKPIPLNYCYIPKYILLHYYSKINVFKPLHYIGITFQNNYSNPQLKHLNLALTSPRDIWPKKNTNKLSLLFFSSPQHCHFSAFFLSSRPFIINMLRVVNGRSHQAKKIASNMLLRNNLALLKTTKKKNWSNGNSTKITLAVKSNYKIQGPFQKKGKYYMMATPY